MTMYTEEQLTELAEAKGIPADQQKGWVTERQQEQRNANPEFSTDPGVLCPAITEALGGLGGAKVTRVIYTRTSPPEYRVETDRGVVKLGDPKRWTIRFSEVRGAFSHVGRGMPLDLRGADRDQVVNMILRAAEEHDLGDYATEAGEARMWLDSFTDLFGVKREDDKQARYFEADSSLYVRKDGRVVVLIAHAHRHVRTYFSPPDLTNKAFAERMEQAGCKTWKEPFKKEDGSRSTRDVLILPSGMRIRGDITAGAGARTEGGEQ